MPRAGISVAAVLAAAALSGCGGAAHPTVTEPKATPVSITLGSSAVPRGDLPPQYTCDGRNISPPITWGTVPSGVQEVALFAIGAVQRSNGQRVLSVEWAMAGLKPITHRLRAGEVPPGAFVLTNSNDRKDYSICPARGQTQRYVFGLYALPRSARASPRIPGAALLQNLTASSPEDESPASGAFLATYKRR